VIGIGPRRPFGKEWGFSCSNRRRERQSGWIGKMGGQAQECRMGTYFHPAGREAERQGGAECFYVGGLKAV